jgi:hypothetical protein
MGNSLVKRTTAGAGIGVSRRRAAIALATATVMCWWGIPAGLARQELTDGTLLVRGNTVLPGGEMAWRVVEDGAEQGTDAIFQQRALGFTVNTAFGDLLLTDEATGSAYRLAPDEAAFVTQGTMQRRESLGRTPERYLRIGLVQAGLETDAGGDRMVFSGPVFTAPASRVTLTLERFNLNDGDGAYASPGQGQALILVLQGEIEIEEGEAGPRMHLQTVVGSGTSYAAHATPWSTSITAMRDATYVLVASMQ